MKMMLACPECHPGLTGILPTLQHVEVTDNGYYLLTCVYGHKALIVNQQQKFEILFENGAHALIDGYYRESILSFTASLERFYEFFIRLINRAYKTDLKILDTVWKHVVSQSERQLGAYIFLYLHTFKENPQLLHSSKVSLRNNVAHKGYIPTKDEALEYGQAVLNIISDVIIRLKIEYQEPINQEILSHIQKGYEKAQNLGLKPSTFHTATIISMGEILTTVKNLRNEIEQLSERRKMEEQACTYLANIHDLGQNLAGIFQKE